MEQLIFLGAPGSGKGTQASKLVQSRKFKHVSTGDLLRAEIKKGSDLGNKVNDIIKAGNLVDDVTMLELLKVNCDLNSGQYIFDGFPRNIDQAKALEDQVLAGNSSRAVYFNMPAEVLVERLTSRRVCRGCSAVYNLKFLPPTQPGICDKCGSDELYQREDDKEEVIRNRMQVYADTIGPVLDYYRVRNTLIEIDASEHIDTVFEKLSSVV